ncbi:excinuclease ABC subunit UvrA [Rosistilla oblonga]|uniref:excinuclease ABC subunit UvrA n=1 Tax=Rosistilla oblonga TaxID=2527990 RepID=UPI003A96FEC4
MVTKLQRIETFMTNPSGTLEPQTLSDIRSAPGDPLMRIRGARVHNLKNVDIDLRRDQLIVLTGVSGSGKSSLAFDTIYAEGQRQYIESLSTYARQFLDQLPRPDCDHIDGLEPTLCIDQKSGASNPRSTVATVTEVYDYLRLLMARVGAPHCYHCGAAILQQTSEQILASLMNLAEETRLIVLAPMVRGRKGAHEDVFQEIRKAGLVRARVDGTMYDIESLPKLSPRKNHTIEAVVDRLVVREGIESRLGESIKTALKLSDGLLIAFFELPDADDWDERLLSSRYACPQCDISYEELEPRTFSFNSPYGACPDCDGLGRLEAYDPDLLIPDWTQPAEVAAMLPWKGTSAAVRKRIRGTLEPLVLDGGGQWDQPLDQLSAKGRSTLTATIVEMLNVEWEKKLTEARREQLTNWIGAVECSTCGGSRLRREALSVTLADRHIGQIVAMPATEATVFFAALQAECDQSLQDDSAYDVESEATADASVVRERAPRRVKVGGQLSPSQREIARPILVEINKRLRFLDQVGVGYLTLGRSADTLSGGELQRVRLATSIGSGLVGVCYILDEPSIGLHQRDNDRLIVALRDLQRQGNTVLVVEHDESMMRAADWLIDMGPGAGHQGGEILFAGEPSSITAIADEQAEAADADSDRPSRSVTADYLSGRRSIPVPESRRKADKNQMLTLAGANTHNLQNVTARFPLGCLIGVAGVSGSGKSSIVNDTLYPALARTLGLQSPKPGPFESLTGADGIDKLIRIDQAPIGRTPRSCPATYTGALDLIRKVFAETRDAKQRGFAANRFSFNAKPGRCDQCMGQGQEKIEMNFLADLYVRCSVCGGKRFNRQTLAVRFKGASIADVLEMTIDDAAEFFKNFVKIDRILESMRSVGLGYLRLGQPSTTLSGGEAQRIKLATELARQETGNTLYLLDEPTTGLHFDDVRRLIDVLQSLVEKGNTVIVIEHNLDVIKCCDWIVEMGPEGGAGGGRLLAEGTPEKVVAGPQTPTSGYLQELLDAAVS